MRQKYNLLRPKRPTFLEYGEARFVFAYHVGLITLSMQSVLSLASIR